MVSIIPDIKVKVNELILTWLSQDHVLDQLHDDLNCIIKGSVPDITPSKLSLSRSLSPPHHLVKHPQSPRNSPRVSRQKSTRTPSPSIELKRVSSTTLQSETKKNSIVIPQFYFPLGRPDTVDNPSTEKMNKIKALFEECPDSLIPKAEFGGVTKSIDLPLYWKTPLFEACSSTLSCSLEQFMQVYEDLRLSCHDNAAKFVRLLSKGQRDYLVQADFQSLIQDVIDTHPGMTFLDDAPEFHSRYIETVTGRIMYCVNRSWSRKLTMAELRNSSFLTVLASLEDEPDINQISEFFSYEHFYVIYCKFWELDSDHDLMINLEDIKKHADGTVNPRALERLFEGTITFKQTKTLSYYDFIWFLLSEEDKAHPTAVEMWFRVMDLDGDGFISLYELEYFYEAQLDKMRLLGVEECSVLDCICQALDLVCPKDKTKISLSDIKRCKQAPLFFNIFLNIQKFLDHELKDPFSTKDGEAPMTDWERFAAREYEELIADEELNKQYEYEDDFEDEDEDGDIGGLANNSSLVATYSPNNHVI